MNLVIDYNNIDYNKFLYDSSITTLTVNDSNLTTLSLSELPQLKTIIFDNVRLFKIVIESLPNIKEISFNNCIIGTLTCEFLPNLESLIFDSNNTIIEVVLDNIPLVSKLTFVGKHNIKSLSVTRMESLTTITSISINLGSLFLSDVESLKHLYIQNNKLGSLSLNDIPLLTKIFCQNNIYLEVVDLNLPLLQKFQASGCSIYSLSIKAPKLTYLNLNENNLKNIDLSTLPNLTQLYIDTNLLETLNVSNLDKLQKLYCENNYWLSQLIFEPNDLICLSLQELVCNNSYIGNLDVSSLVNLRKLSASDCKLISFKISPLTHLIDINISNNPSINSDNYSSTLLECKKLKTITL